MGDIFVLSSLNNAPLPAMAADFFLPVLALYDRYCHAIYTPALIMLQTSESRDMGPSSRNFEIGLQWITGDITA